VELLVVVAILGILMSMMAVSIPLVMKRADVRATQIEIQQLVQAANSYLNAFGDYPPTSFVSPPLAIATNGINEGNESLIAHITTRKRGGPYHEAFSDNRLGNSDNDQLGQRDLAKVRQQLDWTRGNAALLEYNDLWGNPFVYIHHRDYSSRRRLAYTDGSGRQVEVQAAKSAKQGTFQASTSFQIWSFGPNRINDNGEGDDVVSWKD
jgi:type II secretory pathway pseudopilin PulG